MSELPVDSPIGKMNKSCSMTDSVVGHFGLISIG